MVVRFDGAALRRQAGRATSTLHTPSSAPNNDPEPIGVDGDPASRRPGGVSEAAAKVREAARKSKSGTAGPGGVSGAMAADGAADEEERAEPGTVEEKLEREMGGGLASEVLQEEAEKEAGPEVSAEGGTEEVLGGKVGQKGQG